MSQFRVGRSVRFLKQTLSRAGKRRLRVHVSDRHTMRPLRKINHTSSHDRCRPGTPASVSPLKVTDDLHIACGSNSRHLRSAVQGSIDVFRGQSRRFPSNHAPVVLVISETVPLLHLKTLVAACFAQKIACVSWGYDHDAGCICKKMQTTRLTRSRMTFRRCTLANLRLNSIANLKAWR